MKPEDIVTSLSMSRKLKEAGWERETIFSWFEWGNGDYEVARTGDFPDDDAIPAPTSAEIMSVLHFHMKTPKRIVIEGPEIEECENLEDHFAQFWLHAKEK